MGCRGGSKGGRAAVVAVLDVDPAMDLLYAEYLATLAWSEALSDVFKLIGPSRLPRRMQSLGSHEPRAAADRGAAAGNAVEGGLDGAGAGRGGHGAAGNRLRNYSRDVV